MLLTPLHLHSTFSCYFMSCYFFCNGCIFLVLFFFSSCSWEIEIILISIFKQYIYIFLCNRRFLWRKRIPGSGRIITLCSCRSQVSFTIIFIVAGGTGIEDDGNVAPVNYLNSFRFSCTRTCNRIFSKDFVGASLRTQY